MLEQVKDVVAQINRVKLIVDRVLATEVDVVLADGFVESKEMLGLTISCAGTGRCVVSSYRTDSHHPRACKEEEKRAESREVWLERFGVQRPIDLPRGRL